MNSYLNNIDTTKVPTHVAIIMDGNGRWAKQIGKNRLFGHQNAITAIRQSTEFAAEIGIKFLTLYAFSTENWCRPDDEVKEKYSKGGYISYGEISTALELAKRKYLQQHCAEHLQILKAVNNRFI